ncbi:progestin and adipoQ receptor family member 3 isoform X1 [Lucilia sericata]|uniref:progestin and adipoQ receptor family member 3 isoform X1 n=1 Tax=Lucilia sericata TaxID=13632 RepID=UPI0018A81EE5|nr:progestin and adipoQ receptor family member 3 isoform X1 [Lucilia sericata]XP_037824384.1 progestin and adipoQ receptor family member 3 isoform X1 [Lucilia sericata]XP_037824392.1 progestin and adipoQ receptor family member 3 isoform X1 [Lucilia sericata]XP_037824399.1 progestin and adipoQ receptor family member 3 isoform X1 [Lucilia sericata]
MNQYDMTSSQFLADCGQTITTTTTCYKRNNNINNNNNSDKTHDDGDQKNEGPRHVSALDSHQFPDNEEPNILGHGSPAADLLTQNNSCCSKANDCDDADKYNKYKLLLNFEDAPDHLKFNPYIRGGYRTFLSTKLCLQSVFWWTNETINIWTHLCGCLMFIGLTIFDFQFLKVHAELEDQILVVCLLICFCLCMLLSSIYHIFSCKSEEHYELFLSVDYLGISLSLVAIYISSMYYAFWCFNNLRIIYSVIALGMFGLAMIVQIPKLNVSLNGKIAVLFTWAAYGVIPLGHWTVKMGGLENELVGLMVPRVITMYALCAIAFVIYAAKIPERWLTGKVDYFGHSHNWWHLFILAAFYHWHNTGMVYAEYRLNNGCNGPLLT